MSFESKLISRSLSNSTHKRDARGKNVWGNLFFIILTHIDLLFKFFYEYGFDFADIFACAHRFLEFLNVVYAVLRNLLHRFFSWFELIWISCRFYVEVQGFEVIILTKRCQWYASSDFALSLQPLYTVALTCYKDRGVLYQTSDSCKFRHDLRLLLKGPSESGSKQDGSMRINQNESSVPDPDQMTWLHSTIFYSVYKKGERDLLFLSATWRFY